MRPFYQTTVFVISILFLAGCTNEGALPHTSSESRGAAITVGEYANIELGEGLNMTATADPTLTDEQKANRAGTGNSCFDYYRTEPKVVDSPMLRAFWVYGEDDIDVRFDRALQVQNEPTEQYYMHKGWRRHFKEKLSRVFQHNDVPTLAMLVRVPLISQSVEPQPFIVTDGLCAGSSTMAPEDFIRDCGVRYYGGYERGDWVLFWIQADQLDTTEQWPAVLEILQASTNNDVNVNQAFDALAPILGKVSLGAAFTLDNRLDDLGFEEPTLEIWKAYKELVSREAQQAIDDNRIDIFLLLLRQDFPAYTETMLTMCGIPNTVIDGLACYGSFMKAAEELQNYGATKTRQLEDMLPNPQDYEQFDEAAVRELVQRADNQLRRLSVDVATCEAAADTGSVAAMCLAACPQHVGSLLAELENTSIRPAQPRQQVVPVPGAGTRVNQYRVDRKSGPKAARGRMCALTAIGGKFAGLGERVWMEHVGGDGYAVIAESKLKKKSDDPYVVMSCADDVYDSNLGQVTQTVPFGSMINIQETQLQDSQDNSTPLPGFTNLHLLSGFGGFMNGFGEGVRVKEKTNTQLTDRLSVRTKTNRNVEGSALSGVLEANTGLHTIFNEATVESPNIPSNHIATKFLGSTKDQFCYLTATAGNFEGRGEYVKLEQRDGVWVLKAWGGDDSFFLSRARKTIRGRARCVSYTQQ